MFPLDKILYEKEFKGMDIVICGHSLGGAIASIVAIKASIVLKLLLQKRSVTCITFGAPLIGDRDLQKFVAEQMSPNIHNFVYINDPVPKIIGYTQSVSPMLQDIKTRLIAFKHSMLSLEDKSSVGGILNRLLSMKNYYSSVSQAIDSAMPIIEMAVNVARLVYPELSEVKDFQESFSLIVDSSTGVKYNRNFYVPVGNFHFLFENFNDNNFFSCESSKELERYMQVKYQQKIKDISLNAHCLSCYTDLFRKNGNLPFGKYSGHFQEPSTVNGKVEFVGRNIQFKHLFRPSIDSVELIQNKNVLKLSFTGKNIDNVVLELCRFNFDIPFAKNIEEVKIRKTSIAEHIGRLIIEEVNDRKIEILDQEKLILLVTQFGQCEKVLRSENLRNIVVENTRQIAENDSISLVVRRAIQRGMALKKLKSETDCTSPEQIEIIDEIVQLGTVAIGEEEMKKIEVEIFTDYVKQIDYVFSHEKSYRNVIDFCLKIEEYIRSPLHLEAEWTSLRKIGVGFSVIAGAAIAGFIAGPGVALIGLAGATSNGLVSLGAGALASGAIETFLFKDQLTDGNYKNTLNFIVQELFEAQQESLSATEKAEINDLRDQENIFSMEKALIRLAPKNKLDFFRDSTMGKYTKKSLEEVIKRITAIQSIHSIREIFSQQYFIGVVGLQDAGKTTLIKKIWNVGDKSGYFSHTDVPKLYQITRKLLVVDFPGSNSLDYYSRTFSICGAMNNMVIVVIPFSGDISETYSQEIAKVFGVMKGSDSTRVILCINKCGLYLSQLREELILQKNPADYLKKRFINKLNNQYERNKQPICLRSTDIFFTDWELESHQESMHFGIIGVEEIKVIIKDFLVDNNIYNESEVNELQKCVSYV